MAGRLLFARPLRVGLVSTLALLVFLCAGGGADAAMLLVVHDATMDCAADDTPDLRHDCRATAPELPLLALPSISADVAIRDEHARAVTAPAVVMTREPPSRYRVPRAPPVV